MPETIAEIIFPCPLRKSFDYLIPPDMNIKSGMRVIAPFGKRSAVGLVYSLKQHSDFDKNALKPISKVLDESPILNKDIFKLCQWATQYYQQPIGDVFFTALPSLLRKGKPSEIKTAIKETSGEHEKNLTLNEEQQHAVTQINKHKDSFNVFLLDGVTGSGKTEVYFQAIEQHLNDDQQVLVLIPEISLTPQTIGRFENRFNHVVVALHSGLTDKQRLNGWCLARSGEAKIIIGTRSAIFTQFKHLSLIVIDEEHDTSFKQQEGYRYHARDLAVLRAKTHNIPIILGSATPSLESLANVLQKKYQLLTLKHRAGNACPPTFSTIDLNQHYAEDGLTPSSVEKITQHINNNQQVLIFINRRGFAPVIFCQSCNWQATCSRCDSKMVMHKKHSKLCCHHCGRQAVLPDQCPECESPSLLPLGDGTQRLESHLEKLFPKTKILRIDRDNVKTKNQLNEYLEQIHQEKNCILIGTQMLAKGHHFPNVTLVVVLNVDSGLMSADFNALEKTGQLILQVAGRAGRGDKPGEVLIETKQPHHPQLLQLIHKSYQHFAKTLLSERESCHLPPYGFHALIRTEAKVPQQAFDSLRAMQHYLTKFQDSQSQIYDPMPAPMQKKAGFYRAQLLIHASSRGALQKLLHQSLSYFDDNAVIKKSRWSIDVDPVDLT
jgi:primosomal protein N' (replication factor Y) (superfamily II helicase)